jgi:hypothetical protein
MSSDKEPCFATASQVEQSYSEYQDGLNVQNCARADAAKELNPPMDQYVQFLWENFGEADLPPPPPEFHRRGASLPCDDDDDNRSSAIGANPFPIPNPNGYWR